MDIRVDFGDETIRVVFAAESGFAALDRRRELGYEESLDRSAAVRNDFFKIDEVTARKALAMWEAAGGATRIGGSGITFDAPREAFIDHDPGLFEHMVVYLEKVGQHKLDEQYTTRATFVRIWRAVFCRIATPAQIHLLETLEKNGFWE